MTNGVNVLTAMRLLGEAAYTANLVLSNFDRVENPEAQFNRAIAELEAYLRRDRLIPQMRGNIEEIAESYKQVVAER